MLPALTVSRRRLGARRVLLGAASGVLGLAAITSQVVAPSPPARSASLADDLRPSSWAMSIPVAWLAASVPGVRRGDVLDILAVRSGDRAYAVPVAYAVIVLSADERALVLDVAEDDAIAVVNARGVGLLLVPLLRSTK